MDLAARVQLITNPQEFTRLCNALLAAEHGDDFLPIDDDLADRGNDGYLKSEQRMFAAHSFKRVQNQGIQTAIRKKMIGDLGKAIALKNAEVWEINAWTFLSNYPVSADIGAEIVKIGLKADVDVSWRGPEYFEQALAKHALVRAMFPDLQWDDLSDSLQRVETALGIGANNESATTQGLPSSSEILNDREPGWEFLLFARVVLDERDALEPAWHDYRRGLTQHPIQVLDNEEASAYLSKQSTRLIAMTSAVEKIFDRSCQEEAFGAPGEAGNPVLIQHLGAWTVRSYRDMMDWASETRAARPPDEMARLFEMSARMVDRPLNDMRSFFDHVIETFGGVRELLELKSEEPIELNLVMTLQADEQLVEEICNESERLARR